MPRAKAGVGDQKLGNVRRETERPELQSLESARLMKWHG